MRASEKAYEALLNDILNWELPPGAVLAEVELSHQLGVSRTPVREAVAKLIANGLAETQPGRSTVVTAVSVEDVADMFVLRRVLESELVSLAATNNTTDDFARDFARLAKEFRQIPAEAFNAPEPYYQLVATLDQLIDDAADNAYLTGAMENLRVHLTRVRRLAKDNPQRLAASAQEHANIAQAIAQRDPVLAVAATVVHLQTALHHILAQPHTPKGPR